MKLTFVNFKSGLTRFLHTLLISGILALLVFASMGYLAVRLSCLGYVRSAKGMDRVEAGDHVFAAGFELKTAPAIVPSSPKSKAFGDFVTAEINGDVFSGGDALLSFKAKDLTLPA